jgi:hypothetical protein
VSVMAKRRRRFPFNDFPQRVRNCGLLQALFYMTFNP